MVTDSHGYEAFSSGLRFKVYSDPTVTTPIPSQGTADVGQILTFSTTPGGGPGSYYMYAWTTSSELGCTLTNSTIIRCIPIAAGSMYTVMVTITDSNGFTSSSSVLSIVIYSDPSVGSPSATRTALDIGQPTTVSISVSGGSGGFSYTWTGLPTGCSAASSASMSCTPNASGTYNAIRVVVTDSNEAMATSGYLTVTVATDPMVTAPTASPGSGLIDVGQAIVISTTSSGGSGGYSYAWSGLPTGCTTTNSANTACTPTGSGTFLVSVTVTDSNGFSVSSSILSYMVHSDPTVSAPSPNRGSVDVGQSVTFTASPTGGSGGYTYAWTQSSSSFGCILTGSATITCTPMVLGVYTVTIAVTDSNGMSTNAASSANYTVYSDPTVATPGAMPGSGHIDVGQTVSYSTMTVGGSGAVVLAWFGLPTGCMSNSALSLSCIPTGPGTFTVLVTVTDSNCWTTTSTALNYTVYPDPTDSTPAASPLPSLVYQGLSLSTTASGGAPGGYTYLWSNLPPGCSSVNGPQLACTPTVATIYDVTVSVTDTNNFTVTSPSLVLIVYLERVDISVSIVGTPGNAVNVTILDNGVPMAWVVDERPAGSPSVATLDNIYLQAGHNYTLRTTYVPSTDGSHHGRAHGANPVILTVSYAGNATGTFTGYHVFNAAHPSTYAWDIDLGQVTSFTGQQFMWSFGPVTVWVLENANIGLVIVVVVINP